jgi:hypothetical protein
MAVPTVMADLSTTANSNSPAGSESPISTDDFHRAIQAILRHTQFKGADIASATTTDIGAATGGFVDVTGTTTITGLGTIAAGIERTVRFTGALTLTHNGTSLILPGAANITTASNDTAIFRSLGSGNWLCVAYKKADGTALLISAQYINALTTVTALAADYVAIADASDSGNAKKALISDIVALVGAPRNYISGLILSTAGASTTMAISAGQAADSANAVTMSLAASISKTTSAWAVGSGNGGLDTGTIANSTAYTFYLIRRPDTGVVDVIFSTNATSPTLPADYTQYRKLHRGRTNGSAQWVADYWTGDTVLYADLIADGGGGYSSTATLEDLSVPPLTEAIVQVNSNDTDGDLGRISSPFTTDVTTTTVNANITATTAGARTLAELRVRTNASSQVRVRSNSAAMQININTLGYVDRRGID